MGSSGDIVARATQWVKLASVAWIAGQGVWGLGAGGWMNLSSAEARLPRRPTKRSTTGLVGIWR